MELVTSFIILKGFRQHSDDEHVASHHITSLTYNRQSRRIQIHERDSPMKADYVNERLADNYGSSEKPEVDK